MGKRAQHLDCDLSREPPCLPLPHAVIAAQGPYPRAPRVRSGKTPL